MFKPFVNCGISYLMWVCRSRLSNNCILICNVQILPYYRLTIAMCVELNMSVAIMLGMLKRIDIDY